MSIAQENFRSLRGRISSASGSARQIWQKYLKWIDTSPEKRILNYFAWIAFGSAIALSEDYLNKPMMLEEMSVYEGVLENFSRKPTRFGACGAKLVIKTLAGTDIEFRSHTGNDYKIFIGKSVKIWARERNYNSWCFSATRYLHQIMIDGHFVKQYTDEEYRRHVKDHEEGWKWWVGIPTSIGLLCLLGLWRTDRRDRRKFDQSIEK